jgi:2-polyprenyl-3-methyl-5-hydroxy-6-metoxy-1,4-benzoquinol methylase
MCVLKDFLSKCARKAVNALVPLRQREIAMWRLFGVKIDRNQWLTRSEDSWSTYRDLMQLSWDETRTKYQNYFCRLSFAVGHCQGHVLEVGCGTGSMTRWISTNKNVKAITAIDISPEAIEEIKKYGIPKVYAVPMNTNNIEFPQGTSFDTIVLCEVLEHLYPDEEAQMLSALRPYIHPKTTFVVSTPIGWMADPFHVRGFTQEEFTAHLKKYYGTPLEVNLGSGYSQSAFGYLRNTGC